MEQLLIKGGTPLVGRVRISGAKNAALPIMAASLLTQREIRIENLPDVVDVRTMGRLLSHLGVKVSFSRSSVTLDASGELELEAPYNLVKRMRASYYVLGPLVARLGEARVSLPGGCAIGARPIDLHLKGMRQLGCEIDISQGYIHARTSGLVGKHLFISGTKGPSVGATINVMLASTLAKGKTILEGAACEPEVTDCADFLNSIGARIEGAGSPIVTVRGVKHLRGGKHRIIPDRIEAGTYACAAAITRGELEIVRCRPEHMKAVLEKLTEAGVVIEVEKRSLLVRTPGKLRPTNTTVDQYPGFPTDMQAQMTALMAVVPGTSVITETIFENRFMHVPELLRMGANMRVEGNHAIVTGVKKLTGAPVMASDLRASVALVLAGLVAGGQTRISRIYHLDRGYDSFDEKMRRLGARMERVKEDR
jgi:UDP-N-acetylglucosamine 1-carboxyvinyltransferase